MTEIEVDEIFALMGGIYPKGHGINRSATCPLAPWTHSSGADKSPSLTVKAGDPALFKCWSCKQQGTVKVLARKYGEHSGDYTAYELAKQYEPSEDSGTVWGKVSTIRYGASVHRLKQIQKSKESKEKKFKLVTEEDLKKWLEKVPEYALSRLTKKEILDYEIGYDAQEKRMIIPIRDQKGKLVGVSGRDVTGKAKPKYKHYPGLRKEQYFYGEQWLDENLKRAHIVEGFADVWGLRRHGLKNVFATMGTSLSLDQLKKLQRWASYIVVFPDMDLPGLQFAETVAEKLARTQIVVSVAGCEINPKFVHAFRERKWRDTDYRLKWPEKWQGRDPGDLNAEEIQEAMRMAKFYTYRNHGYEVE